VHAFPSLGALRPVGPLVRAPSGVLYGISAEGGPYNLGTVFALTTTGDVTVLHEFDGANGATPNALLLGRDSNLYGTTNSGGVGYDPDSPFLTGSGLVFRLALDGTFTALHKFTNADGGTNPGFLIQASDGVFYGNIHSTQFDGTNVFRMQADGTVATAAPLPQNMQPAGPFLETDGAFYVTANNLQGFGFVCAVILRMTPAGEFTVAYRWVNNPAEVCRVHAFGGLINGPGGYMYGATDQSLFVFAGTVTSFGGPGFVGVAPGDDAGFYALSGSAVFRVDENGVNPLPHLRGCR